MRRPFRSSSRLGLGVAVRRKLRGELVQAGAEHAIEGGERVDHVGECRQRRPQLDGQHQLPDDLGGRDITDEGISSDHIVAIANDYYYGDI